VTVFLPCLPFKRAHVSKFVFLDPNFLYGAGISGDPRTLKAEIGIVMFAWIFRTFWPKMTVFDGKIGEWVVRCCLPTNSFLLFGVVTSLPLLAKIDQEMRTARQTDGHTH